MQTFASCMVAVVVTQEQQSRNINCGFLIVESQTGGLLHCAPVQQTIWYSPLSKVRKTTTAQCRRGRYARNGRAQARYLCPKSFQSSWGQPHDSLGNRAWLWFLPVSRPKCSGSAMKWLHCTCKWLLRNQEPCRKILFTDETMFCSDGITNTRITHNGSTIILVRPRKHISKTVSR
jgi:hypothetical protein